MIKRILTLFLATNMALFCANAWAESDIYLTNNTLQTVTLSIKQSGHHLNKGEHWRQLAYSVPPLATVRYLNLNRNQGIVSGDDYYFDTTVTAEDGSSTTLKQKLIGTWTFSNIWHGANNSSWYDDRGIYSVNQDFIGENTTIAFKAEYASPTGDDFYYIIHPKQPSASRGLNNNLNVLAYNVWALIPGFASHSVPERLNQLKHKINGYDVIIFSELFDNSNRKIFLDGLRAEYPYQTQVVDKPGFEDGGVLIVSRWPIEKEVQMTFDECDKEDCLAAKGVMYAKINKGGNPYHVFGSHTQAWANQDNQETRVKQFTQMREFIDNQYISGAEPVIIGGDLNVDKNKYPHEYDKMLSILGAEEVLRNGGYEYTYGGTVNNWASGGNENLDYVLYSNSHLAPVSSSSKVLVPRSLHADVFTKYDLSDHFAITGNLTFDTPEGDKDTAD